MQRELPDETVNPLTDVYLKAVVKSGMSYTQKWTRIRKLWIQLHPPNHQGYYECYLCFRWITTDALTLDHVKARSRYPELRFELNNLRPCCASCNREKGSKDLEEMIERICTNCHKRIKPGHKPAQKKIYCQCNEGLPF